MGAESGPHDRRHPLLVRHRLLVLGFLTSGPALTSERSKSAQPNEKIKTLILTGQNNQDWKTNSQILKQILGELEVYEYGQEEGILSRLRDYILANKDNPLSREQCEEQLLSFLESGAPLAGKMAVCRHLRQIGSARSVVVLKKMLFQNETSDMARYALEKIPGIEPEKALFESLKNNATKN